MQIRYVLKRCYYEISDRSTSNQQYNKDTPAES